MSPAHNLDSTFAALADPTRRAILARLAAGEASVMELAEAAMWLENYSQFWEARFQRLGVLLEEMKAGEKKRKRSKH
jgi:hypothetical protein